MQSEQLFEVALGVSLPWQVRETRFDTQARTPTIGVDFRPGSRFSHPGVAGEHPVLDTQTRRYRHLNFFQHECFLEVRVPRVRLPDGSVRLIEPPCRAEARPCTQGAALGAAEGSQSAQ